MDPTNYALEPNRYLEQIKDEKNPVRKREILQKYFTERITRSLYQNMDLLYTVDDIGQFKRMYAMISKDLFLNVLLAVDTLTVEEKDDKREYNICESLVIPDD